MKEDKVEGKMSKMKSGRTKSSERENRRRKMRSSHRTTKGETR